jgi:hypothetical protein
VRNDIDLETPATLVWLKAGQEPQPDLFEEAAADRPNAPERWDHFWVAVSYVMNIDWRGGRGPWIKVAGRVLKPSDLRDLLKGRVGDRSEPRSASVPLQGVAPPPLSPTLPTRRPYR